MDDRIDCMTVAEEFGLTQHCGRCHGDNIFDDDLSLPMTMTDGRSVEVCCEVGNRLAERGLLLDWSPRKAESVFTPFWIDEEV